MAKRKKAKKRGRRVPWMKWWTSMDPDTRGRWFRHVGVTVLALTILAAGAMAVTRLQSHVDRQLVESYDHATLTFVDRPSQLVDLIRSDLIADVSDLMTREWTDDHLCRDLAERLEASAWVSLVNFARRTGDARIEVSAEYREPAALIQLGDEFRLVDFEGVRLPGTYLYNPAWKIIQGLSEPPPEPGQVWTGDDLIAGLDVLGVLANEPFSDQVTAVLVDNFGGRRDRHASCIELSTDRAGGRIHWGSAPGMEIAENRVDQKLAILRANFQQTGRVDAGHPIIDITTYPDRFTIPG